MESSRSVLSISEKPNEESAAITAGEFLKRYSLGKDLIFLIFAYASPHLHRRLYPKSYKNPTVTAELLFKYLINATGRLNEIAREFPTAFTWPEAAILINPTFDTRAQVNKSIFSRWKDSVGRIKDSMTGFDNRSQDEMVTLVQDAFRDEDTSVADSIMNLLDFKYLPKPCRQRYFSTFDTALDTSVQQLFRLAARNSVDEIRALKPNKMQVWRTWSNELRSARNGDGFTPLHIAAAAGHEAVVSLLIDEGAPCGSVCLAGLTPLYYAIKFGHKAAALQLIAAMIKNNVNLNTNTHQFGVTPYFIAVELGREKYFTEAGVDPATLKLTYRTPGYASEERRIREIEYQRDNFFTEYNEADDPIIAATVMGAMNILRNLYSVGKGEKVSYSCAQRQIKDCDLLSLAAGFNQFQVVRYILSNHCEELKPRFSWKSRFRNQLLGTDYDDFAFPHQLTRYAKIAAYIMYTLSLYETLNGLSFKQVVAYFLDADHDHLRNAINALRMDILDGNFVPYQFINDPELKQRMTNNQESFLEFTAPLQRITPQ